MTAKRFCIRTASILAAVLLTACGDDSADSDSGLADAGDDIADASDMTDAGDLSDAGDTTDSGDTTDGGMGADGMISRPLMLTGTLRGPVGTQITLRNGDETVELTVTRSPGSTDDYDALSFELGGGEDGDAYEVTIEEQQDDQRCAVYKGETGTLPVADGDLFVGCEWLFDHVSRSSDDSVLGTFFESSAPTIGGSNEAIGATTEGYGEGRFVTFVSSADGLAGADDSARQIYWHDTLTGETRLVSVNAAGDPGDDDSFAPAISADGLHVAFESYATNLVEDDANGLRDVFFWEATSASGGVERISVSDDDEEADGESFSPTLSADGRVAAFVTYASNLTIGVAGNTTANVVRRDLVAHGNTLVTMDAGNNGVGGDRPMLSEDGNRMVLWSFAANLVADDTNGLWDIFVYQHDEGSIDRVSLTSTGDERDQGTESSSRVVAPSISGDGRYVAYATTATNVVPDDTNDLQDVFIVDTQTGDITRASVASSGAQGDGDSPAGQGELIPLSYDGAWAAFTSQATNLGADAAGNVLLHDRVTGETRAVTDVTSGVGAPSLTRSAAFVAFGSGDALDARFDSSGIFSHFTGIARSWWWVED